MVIELLVVVVVGAFKEVVMVEVVVRLLELVWLWVVEEVIGRCWGNWWGRWCIYS